MTAANPPGKSEWQETAVRCVAFFDIMGFSDLVYRHDHAHVQKTMDAVADSVAEKKSWGDKIVFESDSENAEDEVVRIRPVCFSDSILFISGAGTKWDMATTLYMASQFLYEMCQGEVPVKGALAYGKFTANFTTSTFFGRPLVDAYRLAEDTYFYGAPLHHTFEKASKRHEGLPRYRYNQRGKVPMKGGDVTHSWVDWRPHLKDEDVSPDALISSFYQTVSGPTRKYVDNTMSVYVPRGPKPADDPTI